MSTENQQNGSAGGTQSNGIKSSSSSSSASSVASSGVSPSGRTAGLQNNSSFLYSSSTMLNREKARQVPPPTLPKYTSSFNAGSNGGAGTGGTAERLGRDREAGGSYRLASLDRLALRQRILDGEKANGESISTLKMERSKMHFRHSLLLLFDLKKSSDEARETLAEAYDDQAPSYLNCRFWFQRFKSGDFDVNDKERPGPPKKFEDNKLQELLDVNSAETLKELAGQLKVTEIVVSKRLHAMGKIQREGKWLPHELTPIAISNRFNIAVSLLARQKKKTFLWRIVTGDEKWIYYDNPKRKRSWIRTREASTSQPEQNIHRHKLMLCIWWDQQGVVYYELLKPNETVTADVYRHQLNKLNDELLRKRPAIASNRRKVILLHDSARPHVAENVKKTLLQLEWEILPHPVYSPDITPSDYHLFRSMQHDLADTRFRNVEEVRKWVDEWIASKPTSFYRDGIAELPERWERVIENNGKYFD